MRDGGSEFVGEVGGGFEGDVLREGGADPEVAFFERRHEFATDGDEGADADDQHAGGGDPGDPGVTERAFEQVVVVLAKPGTDEGLSGAALVLFGGRHVSEDGSEDEGEDERAAECEAVGDGHRREDLARDSLHGEERDEGDEDDGGGEEYGARCFGDAFDDEVANGLALDAAGELSIDALEHDDGGVDEDAEVDGADGDEVCGTAGEDHHAEGEERGEGDGDGGDEGDARVAEHDQQHQCDEGDAGDYDVPDGVGGVVDEVGAVVERFDVHARRQQASVVQSVDFFLEAVEGGKRFFVFLEQDDADDDVVLLVGADLTEARLESFSYFGDVGDGDGSAVLFSYDDCCDVGFVVDLSDGADVDALIAEGEIVAAGVGVAGLDGVDELGEGDAVGEELVGVGLDLILARGAAEGGDVDDAGDLFDLTSDEPVLSGLDFVEGVAGTDELIAIDFADGRPGGELRLEVVGQGEGLEAIEDLLLIAEGFAAEFEVELDVGEAEDGDGADLFEVRHAAEDGLDGDGDLLLHLFGGPGGILGDDFDERWRGIGVGFDIEARECEDSCRKHARRI